MVILKFLFTLQQLNFYISTGSGCRTSGMSFSEVQYFEEQTAEHYSSPILYICMIFHSWYFNIIKHNPENVVCVHGWFTFVICLCNPRSTVTIEHWCHSTGIPFVLLFISSVLQTPKSCWFKRPKLRRDCSSARWIRSAAKV